MQSDNLVSSRISLHHRHDLLAISGKEFETQSPHAVSIRVCPRRRRRIGYTAETMARVPKEGSIVFSSRPIGREI